MCWCAVAMALPAGCLAKWTSCLCLPIRRYHYFIVSFCWVCVYSCVCECVCVSVCYVSVLHACVRVLFVHTHTSKKACTSKVYNFTPLYLTQTNDISCVRIFIAFVCICSPLPICIRTHSICVQMRIRVFRWAFYLLVPATSCSHTFTIHTETI